MTRAVIDHYLYLLDQAFAGHEEHGFLANIRALLPDDWHWTPPGGDRTARQIAGHVGACLHMYENHAFGDAKMSWADPFFAEMQEQDTEVTDGFLAWIADGQRRFRDSVAALAGDDELLQQRKLSWGGTAETRWIINVMIQHSLYHAGEINHIRALRHGNDRWAWQP